jgi:hypothetical protein
MESLIVVSQLYYLLITRQFAKLTYTGYIYVLMYFLDEDAKLLILFFIVLAAQSI